MKTRSNGTRWEPAEFPQLCRFLAERSPQPMVAVEGASQIVRYVNPAFRRLLSGRDERLIGRPFTEAVPEDMANGCAALLERVLRTGTAEALAEQPHRPGSARGKGALPAHWSYLAWPILGPGERDEKPVGVMIQVTDTTDVASFRRRSVAINEALLKSGLRLHELMEEAEKLNVELQKSDAQERAARLEAQAANRSKEVFLATLSHELRTPLNAILGWATLLRADDHATSAQLDHGLAVIERNARSQARLIEDVLDVARVSSGKFVLDCQPCDLDAVAVAAVDAMLPAALARNIEIHVDTGRDGALTVMADSARLNQVILNLLGNAVKFTPDGGSVTLRLERDTTVPPGVARVVVSDTGRGIAPEFLPVIFDPFKQVDEGNARMFGGLGLGLAIVRHIVELHGGSVAAASEGASRGATFTIELPLPDPPLAAAAERAGKRRDATAPAAAAAIRLDHLRVLVVDDDEEARAVLRMTLEAAGATVVTADSADQGFAVAVREAPPPHVVVSDIAMPGEDGCAFIRRLRTAGASEQDMPAIALSALTGPDDRRNALRAGFQLHLRKPMDPAALIAAVGSLTGRGPANVPRPRRRTGTAHSGAHR